jgi:hypothetical protein
MHCLNNSKSFAGSPQTCMGPCQQQPTSDTAELHACYMLRMMRDLDPHVIKVTVL